MREPRRIQRLEDRLSAYDEDVANVIRLVLLEEQRRLGLRNPRDVITDIERIIEQAVSDSPAEKHEP